MERPGESTPFESGVQGVFRYNGRFSTFGADVTQMLGYTSDSLSAIGIPELVPASEREQVGLLIQSLLSGSGEDVITIDTPIIRGNGSRCRASFELTRAVVAGKAEIFGVIRPGAKGALQGNERGYITLDRFGIIREANESFAKIINKETGILAGAPFVSILPDGEGERVKRLIDLDVHIFDLTLVSATGEKIPTIARVTRTVGDGQLVLLVNDLRNLCGSGTAFCMRETHFYDMFRRHTSIMLIVDPVTQAILDANAAAGRFYGYPVEQLRTMHVSEISVLEPELLRQELENAVHWKKNFFITRQRVAGGQIRDIQENITPVEVNGRTVLFSIVTDITRRKQLEKLIEEKSRQLVSLNRDLSLKVQEEIEKRRQKEQLFIQQSRLAAMGEMIGAIAHQWRQPLNTLGLLIQDIEDAYGFGEVNEAYIREIVGKGMAQIDYMSRTIDDFRNFFRPSKKKEVFDIKNAFVEVLFLIYAQLKHHRVTFQLTCTCTRVHTPEDGQTSLGDCDNHDVTVLGYPNEFKQVVLNIIGNAEDAIIERRHSGDIPEDAEGFIGVEVALDGEDWVVARIFDNAGGIDPSILDRIFEPYFTTKDEGKGTGIGLYMAKAIIENNMCGSISVENTGEGACFTIRLPKADLSYLDSQDSDGSVPY